MMMRALILLTCLLLPGAPAVAQRYGETCFLSGESESGFHRICYYDCLSGTVAITIDLLALCPLTIRR